MRSGHRAAGVVSLAIIGSRVLGLVRDMVFGAMFGAGKFLDAFLAAFQIPNLLRDLFAEGALSTAFTTVFTKTREKEGDAPAWQLASLLFSAMLLIIGAVCAAGILCSPILVQLTNYGFHSVPGKFELTVALTRILFPFILFVSLAAVVMGILNARFIFGLPASASTAFNFVSIVTGVLFAYWFDPQPDWRHPHFSERALYGVSLGVMLGGLAQLAVQLPALWRLGYRFRWRLDLRNDRLREVWTLMWPIVIAGAAVQVNVMVNGIFASEINGARSWLSYAFRLMQFPIGVFGVAVATVTLPAVARHHARGDLPAFGRTVEESLRLVFVLTVPAAVGLFAIAPQIIGLIYQHGEWTGAHTARTAAALRAYTVGLAGYAGIKVLTPCFSALGKPRIPLLVSLFGIGVNLGLNLLLVKALHMGHVGLAASTGVLALVNFLQLLFHMRRHVSLGSAWSWAKLIGSVGAAAALCGMAAWGAARWTVPYGWSPFAGRLLSVLAGTVAGAATYAAAVALLRLPEANAAIDTLRRVLTSGTKRNESAD